MDELLSYTLGFLYADGTVNEKGLVLVYSTDRDIIEKLYNMWNITTKIYSRYKNYYKYKECLGFCFGKIKSAYLLEHGLQRDKNKLKLPAFEGFSFFHWLRGFIDGDGSITRVKGIYRINILGREDLIREISEHVEINHSVFKVDRGRNIVLYNIHFGVEESKELATALYHDATIYLNRKFERVSKLLSYKGKYKYGRGISYDKRRDVYRIRSRNLTFRTLEEAQAYKLEKGL